MQRAVSHQDESSDSWKQVNCSSRYGPAINNVCYIKKTIKWIENTYGQVYLLSHMLYFRNNVSNIWELITEIMVYIIIYNFSIIFNHWKVCFIYYLLIWQCFIQENKQITKAACIVWLYFSLKKVYHKNKDLERHKTRYLQ